VKRTYLLLSALMVFAACNKPSSYNPKNIVVWEQEDAVVAPYIDSVFEDFKKLPGNEGVTITRTHYQNEDLRSQFQAASLAGVPPDLILGPSDTAGLYAVSGFIEPLENIFDFSKYNDQVVQAISLDGHTWGVPVSNGNHLMMFYNKKLVQKAPQNTDELFKYCETSAKNLDLTSCMAFDSGEPFSMIPWLGSFGGWPIDGKIPTLNNEAMKKTIGFYKWLRDEKGYIPKECDYNCMDSLFKENKTAFIINGDWSISSYKDHFKDDFGIALIPENSETGIWPTPMVSGKYFMMSTGLTTEKKKLLADLLNFYTNYDNQVRQYKELARLPALKEAGKDKSITSDEVAEVSMQQILKGKPMPMATEMRAVWDNMRNYLDLAMNGGMSVDTAVEKMQASTEKKIEEMNR